MDLDIVGTSFAVTLAQLLPYVVIPVAAAVMMIRKYPQWTVRLTRVLAVLVVISWLGYWILWSVAFEYLDAYQPVPLLVRISENTALVLMAGGSIALLVIAVTGLVLSFRGQRTATPSSSS